MTRQQHLMQQVAVIDLLLRYVPFCETDTDHDNVMTEIRRVRRGVCEIEEMTKTERQRVVRIKTVIIESEMNHQK